MPDLPLPQSRDEALLWLAVAGELGYLGLFVGTGFSRAATNDVAPSFEGLLQCVAERLDLEADFDNADEYRRKSLPQIASLLLKKCADRGDEGDRATDRFRAEIALACNLKPEGPMAERLRLALEQVCPAWYITTNYDLVLESLAANATSVLPDEPLVPLASRPPIYHLHGHRLVPSSIKVTEEDYVSLLGPIDYQRLKLPLLLFESATLMLGYALGDINVRAAIGWSSTFRNVRDRKLRNWQGRVFQAVRRPEPRQDPYPGADGEIVIEVHSLADLLEELGDKRQQISGFLSQMRTAIRAFLDEPDNAAAIDGNPEKRDQFLGIIERYMAYCPPNLMIDFLGRALDPIWTRARRDLGFVYYDTYIRIIIDILERIRIRTVNPTIFFYIADKLDDVGWYLDAAKSRGSAHAATETWMTEYVRIGAEVLLELDSYAKAHDKYGLKKALALIEAERPGPQ